MSSIHNTAFSSEKRLSHLNQERNMHKLSLQAKTVQNSFIQWIFKEALLNFSKSVPTKKQTHLHVLREGECIFNRFSFLGEPLFLKAS